MPGNEELYQAIMERRSVRRYDEDPLSEETLDKIRCIISDVAPLVPDNVFDVPIHDYCTSDEGLVLRSAYGRFMTPPHIMVPYVVGEAHPLTDLGYRIEQIVVRLTALDIGTCYIGALGAEGSLRVRFDLPDHARIGATVFFGRPASGVGGAVSAVARTLAGGQRRMSVEDLFFVGDFDHPSTPPPEFDTLIEAGRWAPSALNAQPWRLLLQEARLFLFVTTGTLKYLGGERGQYPLYDGGICMANMSLAMEALGKRGSWRMAEETDAEAVDCPNDMQLLSVLNLDE